MKTLKNPIKYQVSSNSAHLAAKSQTSPRNSLTRTLPKYSDGYIYRPAKDNFALLKNTFTKDFSSSCYMDFIHPELNFKFNSVDKAFDLFMQYAISESNWNNGRARSVSPGNVQSNLNKLGNELTLEWTDFMNMMSLTLSEGISPHYDCMIDKSTKLYDYLDNLSTIFHNGNYKADICISVIKNLKSEIRAIQKQSRKIIFTDSGEIDSSKPANLGKLLNRIRQLNDNISNLYTKTMSKSTLTTGELYRAKTAMSQLCGDILQIISGAVNFRQVSQILQSQFYEMNSCLAELFRNIGIPYGITPVLPNTEIIEIDENAENQQKEEADNK